MRTARSRGLNAYAALIVAAVLAGAAAVATLALGGVARERAAIEAGALAQGYWIARSFESAHRARVRDEVTLLGVLLDELLRHEVVRGITILDSGGLVLLAGEPRLVGTRTPPPGDVPKSGLVLDGDPRTPRMLFPLHFAQAHGRSGAPQLHHGAEAEAPRWVAIELDARDAYSHYRRSVLLSGAILAGSVLLGLAACGAILLFIRYRQASASAVRQERIRRGLERFVPRAVRELIADNPVSPSLAKVEREATVLFLDLEGYSRLAEAMDASALNRLVERYFSEFLGLIHAAGGEVNETAGDGMMAIFTSAGQDHAANAVNAAVGIRARARELARERAAGEPDIRVNLGVNSGAVLLGATMIRSASGERLTYTASGTVTNLAARLCQLADGGEICVAGETIRRLRGGIAVEGPQAVAFRNLAEPVRVYRVP